MQVALHFQSDRAHTLRGPLEAAGVDVSDFEGQLLGGEHAVICGSPGLLSEHMGSRVPVILRLRGNMWAERGGGHVGSLRSWFKDQLLSSVCDGVLTPDARLDRMLRERTGVTNTAVVGLPVVEGDWPAVEHTDETLRCLTLTNLDYERKIAPLYRWTTRFEEFAAGTDHRWRICGDGEYSGEFAEHVRNMDSVSFEGFQPARDELAAANLMLHPSGMDITLPNAVLEGVASNLPVVTTEFGAFCETNGVVSIADRRLESTLEWFTDRGERAGHAAQVRREIADSHAPGRIGEQIKQFVESTV